MEPPTLCTSRLVLRQWCEQDFGPYRELTEDPEVAKFIGGVVRGGQAWRQMAMHAGHWALRGYGNWAVSTSDGTFIGRVGFWEPHGWPGLELGWALRRSAWGRGYAVEAAKAALAWGWQQLDPEAVLALIHPDNSPSLRVAQRLNFTAGGQSEISGEPVVLNRLQRPIPAKRSPTAQRK